MARQWILQPGEYMAADDEKPKRSWREIDQNKDRSKHRTEDRPKLNPRSRQRAESASKLYRAKLDSFFSGEGKVPEHVKEKFAGIQNSADGLERKEAVACIAGARSAAERTRAIRAYLDRWELPSDYGMLCEVLACDDEDLVGQALRMISDMFDENRVPKRASLLEQRLRGVATLAEDEELQQQATLLQKRLRLFR
jgi:hypothetical protein